MQKSLQIIHRRPSKGVKRVFTPLDFEISYFTPHKFFKNTLDYHLEHMEPLIQSKKLGRPWVHISLQFALCFFAGTRLYLHFWKIQLTPKTQPTDSTKPLRKEQGYKYYLSLYIYYFNIWTIWK